jgi:hypothetical protein
VAVHGGVVSGEGVVEIVETGLGQAVVQHPYRSRRAYSDRNSLEIASSATSLPPVHVLFET